MNNKIYYHYCSVDTFYNILQTDIIRFGNPLKMNDSAESIWFPAMVKDFMNYWIYIGNLGKILSASRKMLNRENPF